MTELGLWLISRMVKQRIVCTRVTAYRGVPGLCAEAGIEAKCKYEARSQRDQVYSSSVALHVFDLRQHQLSFLKLLTGKNEVSI